MLNAIFEKISHNIPLTKQDAMALLAIENQSELFYRLLAKANKLSREQYENKGYIFAQIGLNAKPCSGNCKFCSLGKDNFAVTAQTDKTIDEVTADVLAIDFTHVHSLFLMTTADYDMEKYLDIAAHVSTMLPAGKKLIANIGDFDYTYAKRLVKAGFNGFYHVVRLREGTDTDILRERRIETIEGAKKAGLELYYCIEPIGTEHTYEEIADEMLRARNWNVNVMAVMRRVNVENTKFFGQSEVTQLEITKIAAVTRLVVQPKTSMNVHEPMYMPLLAGVNQLYAEIGINPRDTAIETKSNRGFSIDNVVKMLEEAEYII